MGVILPEYINFLLQPYSNQMNIGINWTIEYDLNLCMPISASQLLFSQQSVCWFSNILLMIVQLKFDRIKSNEMILLTFESFDFAFTRSLFQQAIQVVVENNIVVKDGIDFNAWCFGRCLFAHYHAHRSQ